MLFGVGPEAAARRHRPQRRGQRRPPTPGGVDRGPRRLVRRPVPLGRGAGVAYMDGLGPARSASGWLVLAIATVARLGTVRHQPGRGGARLERDRRDRSSPRDRRRQGVVRALRCRRSSPDSSSGGGPTAWWRARSWSCARPRPPPVTPPSRRRRWRPSPRRRCISSPWRCGAAGWPFSWSCSRHRAGERWRRSHGTTTCAPLLRRFSRVALVAVAALFVTGGLMAWIQLGGLDALTSSDYGQTLIVKLALIAWSCRSAVHHLRASDEARRLLARTAPVELALVLAVVVVASVLATRAPGRATRGASVLAASATPTAPSHCRDAAIETAECWQRYFSYVVGARGHRHRPRRRAPRVASATRSSAASATN